MIEKTNNRLVFQRATFFSGKLASVLQAERLLKKGWSLYQLTMPYCSVGAVGEYDYALSDGENVMQLTNRTVEQLKHRVIAGELDIDDRLMALNVPFAEKDEAKQLGAIWVGHEKTWAIDFHRDSEPFKKWLSDEPKILGQYLLILQARQEIEQLINTVEGKSDAKFDSNCV